MKNMSFRLKIRVARKLFFFTLYILSYISVSLVWRLISTDIAVRRKFYVRTVSFFSKVALFLLGVRVHVKNQERSKQTFLMVGNHTGFLDILVIAATRPTLFITSVEMRETPGLGLLTEMGGCLYVERRSRTSIQNEIKWIRLALQQGFNVVLFPEGTSTDGSRILPFKKSLMTAVVGTGVKIKPFCINYRKVNNQPMSHQWRDHLFWYGDITFTASLLSLFSLKTIDVELTFLEELHVESEDQRTMVAQTAYQKIVSEYSPILSPEVN